MRQDIDKDAPFFHSSPHLKYMPVCGSSQSIVSKVHMYSCRIPRLCSCDDFSPLLRLNLLSKLNEDCFAAMFSFRNCIYCSLLKKNSLF